MSRADLLPQPRPGRRWASRTARLLPERGPVRRLALLTLVSTTGNGIFFTLSALYYTRILGFSIVSVGAALSIAAVAGLFSGIPVGHLADRRGAREVLVGTMMATGVAIAVLLSVTTYWEFVLLATLVIFFDSGANTARNALIGGTIAGPGRATARAYLRAVSNVGMTLGAGVAAVALHLDTRAAYIAIMYVDAATYVLCGALALGLPRVTPEPGTASRMFSAARDLPYVAVTLVLAVMAMHYWILEIAMPLWVVGHTGAPRWLVSVLVAINTAGVVIFQVTVAKRIDTLRTAVLACGLSGVLLLLACTAFGLSGQVGLGLAVVFLVLAAVLHVFGEMTQAAASFLLSFELAPAASMGAYQGLASVGMAVSAMLAPSTIALLPLRIGLPGWLILGDILLAAGLLAGPAVRWAQRTRAAPVETPG